MRKNKETQESLAEKLNTTDRTLREWIRDPEKKISIDFIVTISLMWKLPDWISKMLLESAGKTLNERNSSMAKTDKEQAHSAEEKQEAISIETAKVIQGISLALKNAALVLKTGEQKDKAGEDLIRFFSVPCKPTKTNGGRTRNLDLSGD